jgi:hypothetical protein
VCAKEEDRTREQSVRLFLSPFAKKRFLRWDPILKIKY